MKSLKKNEPLAADRMSEPQGGESVLLRKRKGMKVKTGTNAPEPGRERVSDECQVWNRNGQ